ncbi:MAG: OprO/OprP family phosphate-selective porin [Muribaculaceae bacterium]|nr:OprO/OprP family phosphate-selective porin [Muribaculaceae bacterium]
MNRNISLLLAGAMLPALSLTAQTTNSGAPLDEKSLFEEVSGIKKKTDKFNVYLNTHADFKADFTGNEFDGGKFEMKQLRLEMRGNINDWITYRYRQRLNKGEGPGGNFDNVLQSIDVAEVGFRVGKVDFVAGKQCASYGGIEFDLNPIEVYDYCDMIENMSNFMTGLRVVYDFAPGQQMQFQVLDGVTRSSEAMYGVIRTAKLPLVYTINWNGTICPAWNTRWSASFMNETYKEHMWYYALGNDFHFTDRFGAYFDWMYSREGIDRKGIITGIVGDRDGHNALNADYMSFVLHLNYFVAPRWNVFAKGSYETAGVSKSEENVHKGNYRTTWTYTAGVEFYPLKERNLHFFLAYVGRNYKYKSDVCAQYGVSDYNTNRVSAGFIWQIPVF